MTVWCAENSGREIPFYDSSNISWLQGSLWFCRWNHHTEEWKINHSKQLKGANNKHSKPVRCITTGEIFANAREGAEYYNADTSRIHKCCKGKEKSSGKHPVTGEKLWRDYVEKANPRTGIEIIEK